jgi:hypothetical protein
MFTESAAGCVDYHGGPFLDHITDAVGKANRGRNGDLHLAEARLHPSSADDPCRGPNDRSCSRSRSFRERGSFINAPRTADHAG